LSEKLRLVWGARAESYYQNIDAINNSGRRIDGDQTFFSLLPSFNLTYSVNSKANFRLAGSKTVSRPELRELAPFAFINQEENTQISGNPLLKMADVLNGDLRFEYYPSGGEAFTTTVFYKDFTNPIEQVVGSSANYSNLTFTYNNAKSAYAYGVEFDVRKKLNFISSASWLNNFVASVNVTLIKSEVDLNQAGQAKRSLQGQSPFLINSGLQYISPKSGFSVNALYNKVGKRIWRVGNESSGIPDFYERGRDIIDIQLSQRVLRSRGELKLNIGDILNQSQVFYQNFDGNTSYQSGKDIGFFNYKSGTTFTLGLAYDLKR
jgi:outer membrane receptor protein involved in Fe transport